MIGTASGPMASILTGERTALNFLCHLSGVATITRRFADAAARPPAPLPDPAAQAPTPDDAVEAS